MSFRMLVNKENLLLALLWQQYLIHPLHCHVCMQKFVKPENYSALEFPGRPTVVNVNIVMRNLVDIDETRKKFKANLQLNLWWTDPRLMGHYVLKENCSVTSVRFDQASLNDIWLPDIAFTNTEYNIYDNFGKVPFSFGNDGTVSTTVSISAVFGCLMDFAKYPHDDFNCLIRIVSTFLRTDDQILKSNLTVAGAFYKKVNAGNIPFKIKVIGVEDHSKEKYSSCIVIFHMSRITTPYLII